MADEFTTVAKVGDVPEGSGLAVSAGEQLIALFLVDGEYFAIADACPHMGASLAVGPLEGDTVTCPWHAWRFCVRDGTWCDNPRIKTDAFEVRIRDDEIQVRVARTEET